MNDEFRIAIRALVDSDDATTQAAFAEIAEMRRYEPFECATELSDVLLEELATGELHTPRLLTLLGTMRQPVPACLPFCLDLLRGLSTTFGKLTPGDRAHAGVETALEYLLDDDSAEVVESAEKSLRLARGI